MYCKDSLCRKETFVQLAELLTKDDAPLTEKRVSVYLLSVLVANNSKIEINFFYIKSAICAHRFVFLLYCALHTMLFFIRQSSVCFQTESGQTFAQTSGCLDVLLYLFRYFIVRKPLAPAHVEFPHCVNFCFVFFVLYFLQNFFSSVHRVCNGEI